MLTYRDRVKGLALLRREQVAPDPNNFRLHGEQQRAALRGTLRAVGVTAAVLVRPTAERALAALRKVPRADPKAFAAWLARHGRGSFALLDGHLRAEELDSPFQALVLDVDAAEGAQVLATFDAVGDLAGFDLAAFERNAGLFEAEDADVRRLLAELTAAAKLEAEQVARLDQQADAQVGGGNEALAPNMGDPPGDGVMPDVARHPLAIVLTNAEKRRWDARKATLGVREDKAALMMLV